MASQLGYNTPSTTSLPRIPSRRRKDSASASELLPRPGTGQHTRTDSDSETESDTVTVTVNLAHHLQQATSQSVRKSLASLS